MLRDWYMCSKIISVKHSLTLKINIKKLFYLTFLVLLSLCKKCPSSFQYSYCDYFFFNILRMKLWSNRKKGKKRSIWIGRWRQTSIVIFRETSGREGRGRIVCDEFGSARFARSTHPRHSLFLGCVPTNAAATSNLGEIVPASLKKRREVFARLLCILLKIVRWNIFVSFFLSLVTW